VDTSKEYIEMCWEATEIQDIWKNRCPVPKYIFDRNYFCNSTTHKSTFTWLPRQDQLQYMLDASVHIVLDIFHSFVFPESDYGEIYPDSIQEKTVNEKEKYVNQFIESYEQLWLAFVMYEKYGKKWNGKDWIKI